MVIVQVDHMGRLANEQRSAVLAMVKIATQADKVAPPSEQVLLAVRGQHPDAGSQSPARSVPLPASAGAPLAGSPHLEQGADGQGCPAEIVVDPSHRRQ